MNLKQNRNKNDNSTLEEWICKACCLIITMLIGILSTYLINYCYAQYQLIIKLSRQKNLSNGIHINRDIHDLPNFQSIKPYVVLFIHRSQSQFVLDELITEAEKTRIFTIVPKTKSLYHDYMFIHVELVQDTQTIIALIEYFPETDKSSTYFYTVRKLFTIMFDSPKTIQTWGNLIHQLKPYVQYGLFSCNEMIQSHSVDIEKVFKPWYNHTFGHNTYCHRYLKYDTMDGSLCSCAHRPYKSSSHQWSILNAIAYTFDEHYNNHIHGIQKCLAITKLAHVVSEKWTIQQLTDYTQRHYITNKIKA